MRCATVAQANRQPLGVLSNDVSGELGCPIHMLATHTCLRRTHAAIAASPLSANVVNSFVDVLLAMLLSFPTLVSFLVQESLDSFLLSLILYLPSRPVDNLFIRTEPPERDMTLPGVAFLGKYAFLPVAVK